MVRFFCLYRVQMVFLRVICGRRAGCDVRVFVCFFFLPLAGGGEIKRSLREREIFFCARKGGNLASSFFCASVRTTRARFSRRFAFCGYSFARTRRVLCARGGAMDGSCAFTNRQKGGRGSRSAVFLFFFFFSSFTSHSHENFSFSKNTAIAKDV